MTQQDYCIDYTNPTIRANRQSLQDFILLRFYFDYKDLEVK
jgi:hypothetical protein